MESKSWKDSFAELERIVLPEDTNPIGDLYGGHLVEWMDNIASISAARHSRRRNVTGSIDSLFFLSPIHLGDIVHLTSRINYVTRSTMEIEVNVFAEDSLTGDMKFTTTSFLTYVAITQDGKPTEVPELKLGDEETIKRFNEGKIRSETRLANLQDAKKRVPKQM